MNDLNQFKNNGFLLKKNLITRKEINKINKVVNEVISKEKERKRSSNQNSTQSYDNYHFVYNSSSSKNKEILTVSALVNISKETDKMLNVIKNDHASIIEIEPFARGLFRVLSTCLSIFESLIASAEATMAYWVNLSIFRASFLSRKSKALNPFNSHANFVLNFSVSK